VLGVPALGSSATADHAVPTACAIRALLLELLPFVGEAPCPSSITFSEDELHHKILTLLQLLPPSLLGLKVGAGGTRAADGTWRWFSSSLPTPSPCSLARPSTARARTSWTSSRCAGCWRLKRLVPSGPDWEGNEGLQHESTAPPDWEVCPE